MNLSSLLNIVRQGGTDMGRARNSRKSDTRLPAVPYAPPRGIPEVPPVPSVPVALTTGVAPVIDTATLEYTPTAEVAFDETMELSAGDGYPVWFIEGMPDWMTLNPITGRIQGTVPTAAVYEYDVYVVTAYGTDSETLVLDAAL